MIESKKEEKLKVLFLSLINEFNIQFFTSLKEIQTPSKQLKNLILVILTIYSNKLDNLLEDNLQLE